MAKQQHAIGTRVVFFNGYELEDITTGRIYTIEGVDELGDEYFIDDAGERDFAAATGNGTPGEGDGVYVVIVD
jgi:hypothetical protein